jgi:hypothetical protein
MKRPYPIGSGGYGNPQTRVYRNFAVGPPLVVAGLCTTVTMAGKSLWANQYRGGQSVETRGVGSGATH